MDVKKSLYTTGQAKIAQTVREMREAAGLTQRDLSAKIDRPRNVIARIEQAQRRVDLLEWIALCEVCGVDPVVKGNELLTKLHDARKN
jgi:ribosome-binding protein aMBF1 (putative translation factor)